MTKNADGGDAALQVLARILRAEKSALGGRLHDGQQQFRSKQSIVVASLFGLRRRYDVEK